MQSIEVDSPMGDILFLNLHMTAGGHLHPESDKINQIRESEIIEAIKAGEDFIREKKEKENEVEAKVVILGDFNCGPDASPVNYELLQPFGYTDAALKHSIENNESFSTWCPRNELNAKGVL